MQQFPSYWTLIDKVDFLQRKILLNSVAERQLGLDLLDPTFKKETLQQLVDLQQICPDATKTLYGYAFKDFTVNMYSDLYLKLNDYDREQIDKICRLYANSANHPMENYYILEEYINREED